MIVEFCRRDRQQAPTQLRQDRCHELKIAGIDRSTAQARIVRHPDIFITLVPKTQAMEAAAALGVFDRNAQPPWGVPFAVEDNIDV